MPSVAAAQPCTKCKEWKHPAEFDRISKDSERRRKRCKACRSGEFRIYRTSRPDEFRARGQAWRDKHRAHYQLYQRRYHQAHAGQVLRQKRQTYLAHRDVIQVKQAHQRAARYDVPGTFTVGEWRAVCRHYGGICLWCQQIRLLTIDHVIPLSRGGTNDIGNLQPLCRNCNSRKGPRVMDFRAVFED